MSQANVTLRLSIVLVTTLASSAVAALPCSEEEKANLLDRIRAPASSGSSVKVTCDVELEPDDVIGHRLIFEGPAASGVTLACNGALLDGSLASKGGDMIEVRSERFAPASENELASFERPMNVTVRGCKIKGSVRVWGMGKNGEAPDVRASSRQSGHTGRARLAAPWYTVLEDLYIESSGRIPVYFSPGVTYATLRRSEIAGGSSSVAIYLDTESYGNVIEDNYIHADTGELVGDREQLAIDGSFGNQIRNNRFSHLNRGGITMYRNCGEGGTVRHTTPSANEIINNVFYYTSKYSQGVPAISIGTRNGAGVNSDNLFRDYCGHDAGFPWGSSVDDRDFARENVVMQNQIYVRPVREAIVVPWPDPNSPNYIAHNTTVTTPVSRRAGCYVGSAYPSFLRHGESTRTLRSSDGSARCTTTRYRCDDGEIVSAYAPGCSVTARPFACSRTGDNDGCKSSFACPTGTVLVGARAACNLEWGFVTDAQLAAVPADGIRVVRPSDDVSAGSCFVGDTTAQSDDETLWTTITSGVTEFGCKESDANGGDCHIRGVAYCAAP